MNPGHLQGTRVQEGFHHFLEKDTVSKTLGMKRRRNPHRSIKSAKAKSRRCRASDLTEGDKLEEKSFQQKGKDDLHETREDI